jgi:Mycobacterium membrane protein
MSYPPPGEPQPGQPVSPVQPMQPVHKSKAGPIIAIIAAVVLVICLGCVGGAWYFGFWFQKKAEEIVNSIPTDYPTNDAAKPGNNSSPHTIRYEINGSGRALVNWAQESGLGSEEVDLPWSKEITVNRQSFGAQVFAIPKEKDTTVESCRISVDGVEKKKANFANSTLICSYVYVS